MGKVYTRFQTIVQKPYHLGWHTAIGLDQMCNKIVKLAAPVFTEQLTDLFKLSLKSLEFPDDWNLANVFPVFEAGECKNPNDYRPIYYQSYQPYLGSLKT